MTSWSNVMLGEVCHFENGDRGKNYPGRKALVPTGIPFINAGHIADGMIDWEGMDFIPKDRFDLLGSGKIQQGDILYCLRGSLGKFGVVDREAEGAIASSLVIVRPTAILDVNYLAYYFRSPLAAGMVERFAGGAAQPNLSAKSLGQYRLPLPPLEEQRRIVALLDEAFEGLARARAHTEANLQSARELLAVCLDEIFGSDDPSWRTESLSELCVIGDGNHSSKYPKNSEMVADGVPFLRSTNIQNGEIHRNEMLYISEAKHAELKKGHLKTGDVLFTNRGEIGKVAIIPQDLEGANLNSQVAWLRCGDKIDHRFLFFFLQSGRMKRHYLDTQSGAALQQFTIKMLKAVTVSFPPLDIQEAAVQRIGQIQNQISLLDSSYRAALQDLDDLRQSLLQKAFAGELT